MRVPDCETGDSLGAKILVILGHWGQKGNTIRDNKGGHFLSTLLDRSMNCKPVELIGLIVGNL